MSAALTWEAPQISLGQRSHVAENPEPITIGAALLILGAVAVVASAGMTIYCDSKGQDFGFSMTWDGVKPTSFSAGCR